MIATITSSNTTRDKKLFGRSIVYVKSVADNIADDFGSAHNVYWLPFKSKVWSKVCRVATKANVKALKELFPEALSIKYSRKAGCSCGCSAGYILKHTPNQYGGTFWVDVKSNDDLELTALTNTINKFESELKEEIAREVPHKTL